jgi:enoyl-CoA hydratase/carnithine racemase
MEGHHGWPADLPESLTLGREGNILIVGLNRPNKRNALDDETILGIERVFSNVPDDVGAAVLHASGKHFSAGLDLSEIGKPDALDGVLHSRMWHRAFNRLQFGSVPVVAVLHGAVVGGGLELAAACHIRVAEASAFYALPEAQRGIFVGGGGSVRVSRLIGVARMADMLLTGRVISAEEGASIGLAQYLVKDGEGLAKALELAKKIAGNSRITNFALIHALPRIAEAGHESGLMMESLMASITQGSPEAKARVHQFLDKKAKKVGED